MRPIKIYTDSTSDLGKDLLTKYNISYFVMKTVYKGVETDARLEWDNVTPKSFYDILRDPSNSRVTTAQVPLTDFTKVLNEEVKNGNDVIYIACSSALSGSYNSARLVSEDILKEHPGAKIRIIDSLRAILAEGILAIKAAELVKENKTIDEIADYIESIKNTAWEYVTVNNLDSLKKAGRVKPSKAFFGNLLGLKPILTSNVNGENVAIKKAKGRLNSFKELIACCKEKVIDPEKQTLYIAHADCINDAEKLKQMVLEEIKFKDVYVNYMGPIIGTSLGADSIGLFFLGKEIKE